VVECRLAAKLLAKSLIQGDRWTSILKLKYVLYSVPHTGDRWTSILKLKYVLYSVLHTGGQVDLHTQAQVFYLLSPSCGVTEGPPCRSSSSKFFTGDRWTSILKLKYVLYSVPQTGREVDLHTQALACSVLSSS